VLRGLWLLCGFKGMKDWALEWGGYVKKLAGWVSSEVEVGGGYGIE
jgi:hypothetical protein